MKIAFIEQESKMGGVEYSTLRLAGSLNHEDFDVQIICPEEGELPELAKRAGLLVSIVERPDFPSVSFLINNRYVPNPFGIIMSFISVLIAAKKLRKYFKHNPVDVVVTKGLMAHFYGGMAVNNQGIPCIWYLQETVNISRAWGFHHKALLWGAENLADKIIVDSEALLLQFDGNNRVIKEISFIPNGLDTNEFRKFSESEKSSAKIALGIPDNALVIGQAGRLIPLKGQMTTLEAFAEIAFSNTDLVLLLVGAPLFGDQGFLSDLKEKTKKLNIADRTFFSGFLPDVRQGLAAMDIFVHASIEPDSPLSVLEAMSCELPVIVSAVPGCIDMVSHGNTGLLFDPGQPMKLADCLDFFIESPEVREKFGIAARKNIIKNYSNKNISKKFEGLIVRNYGK